jgi:AraC family transcriptional regulator
MMPISQVYDVPHGGTLQCRVGGRLALPGSDGRASSLPLLGATGRRVSVIAGFPRSRFVAAARSADGRLAGTSARRTLGDLLFIPADHALETEWGAGEQSSICCAFELDEAAAFDLAPTALEAALDVRSASVRETMMRLAREIAHPALVQRGARGGALHATARGTRPLHAWLRKGERSAAGLTKAQLRTSTS